MDEKLKRKVEDCTKKNMVIDKNNKKIIFDYGKFEGCMAE